MNRDGGSSIVEALVGLALGAIAVGVLACSVLIGVRALALANAWVRKQRPPTMASNGCGTGRPVRPATCCDRAGHRPTVRAHGRARPPDALVVESTWTSVAGPHPFAVTSEQAP